MHVLTCCCRSAARTPVEVIWILGAAPVLPGQSEAAAKRRIARSDARTLQHDVMTPFPGDERFDSISLFYLLHCLHGPLDARAAIFAHLKHNLTPDGVLSGATILGDEAGHNGFGRKLMSVYTKKGISEAAGTRKPVSTWRTRGPDPLAAPICGSTSRCKAQGGRRRSAVSRSRADCLSRADQAELQPTYSPKAQSPRITE